MGAKNTKFGLGFRLDVIIFRRNSISCIYPCAYNRYQPKVTTMIQNKTAIIKLFRPKSLAELSHLSEHCEPIFASQKAGGQEPAKER